MLGAIGGLSGGLWVPVVSHLSSSVPPLLAGGTSGVGHSAIWPGLRGGVQYITLSMLVSMFVTVVGVLLG